MERGSYFDAWYRDEHCYHPSLPMRRIQMVEDLERYHVTLLVWSALGGGSLSLPYLEEEAFGQVPARLRFYGYMNDQEFIRECDKRGIKVFGVVFEVQGWEFPVELSEDESQLLSLSKTFGEGKPGWYGLREFTQNRYPKLFGGKRCEDYFPGGLVNSAGERVSDLWEECAARVIDGTAVHAGWVEVVGHPHQCYQMCRNNPVWRQYMKKIIEIQIDAGVHGVHLDECELPITAVSRGGCFCKDCMAQFREYLLRRQAEGTLPADLQALDLSAFHYGDYLKARGAQVPGPRAEIPHFNLYMAFQMEAITRYFREMCDFVREYGAKKGRKVLVSGNFFNLQTCYVPLEPNVDIVVTEQRQTIFRQIPWYRYCVGFAGTKPVVVVENPYGGVIPDLLQRVKEGRSYDKYRLLLLEGAAYGVNHAVPYGAWMGNTIRDAFYPPREATSEVQDFLRSKEGLFGGPSGAEVAMLFSFPSYDQREAPRAAAGLMENRRAVNALSFAEYEDSGLPFWDLARVLADRQTPFDVIMLADGCLRPDDFSAGALNGYRCAVVPDSPAMTAGQVEALLAYVQGGGRLMVYGRMAENVATPARAALLAHPNTVQMVLGAGDPAEVGAVAARIASLLPEGRAQVETSAPEDLGVNLQQAGPERAVLHLVNYRYDIARDCSAPIANLQVSLRLGFTPAAAALHTLQGEFPLPVTVQNGRTQVTVAEFPLYGAIEFTA
ncbi:MAG TPA: alpha-amylase family protein [Symbiobacteriaceae bacterium]|nr:alpha-amylase family protein [Symbiobacteriaceae bacterium]